MSGKISLAHGNGGVLMRELIAEIFVKHLGNPHLDTSADAVGVPMPGSGEIVLTTDGFTVKPLEYPGGNIGSLAVHGTVNDLAVAGADPCYLTLNAFLEEGLELDLLDRAIRALGEAAAEAEVPVVAGDTKVLARGDCDGIYLATTGVGVRRGWWRPKAESIELGDAIIVSGPVGSHGAAVLLARGEYGWEGDLRSDSQSVVPVCRAVRSMQKARFMRDPTRGGLATVLHEIAAASGSCVCIDEAQLPVEEQVQAVCEILGFDPLYLACEGRMVCVVAASEAQSALEAIQAAGATGAAIIGEVCDGASEVVLKTALGGERVIDELVEDPLPRIC